MEHHQRRIDIPYTPLVIDSNEECIAYAKPVVPQSFATRQRRASIFFISSCVIALVLSAFNLTFLSASNFLAYLTAKMKEPMKAPSVYVGLEKVHFDHALCRSRGTFPKAFYTFPLQDSNGNLKRVHAPDDKVSLSFGGSVLAYVDFYVPDFGLENCTLTAKLRDDPYNTTSRTLNVFTVPRQDDVTSKVFFDAIEVQPGTESATKPLFCPSRSHIYFMLQCQDCAIDFPLEGVTSLTASAESLQKTGFRLTQYEALDCVPVRND